MSEPILTISKLSLELSTGLKTIRVLQDVSLNVNHGETVCVVGESGCGKSLTALSVARLIPSPPARYVSGSIRVTGKEVFDMAPKELRSIRGPIVSYIFQDPSASMNPVFRVGTQIMESLKLHQPKLATTHEVHRLLAWVGIPSPEQRASAYPHELSGGMLQRVMIAMALASKPKLLIADEPTTALDVTIQAQLLALLRELQIQTGLSILLITHNLGLLSHIAHRVVVMYAGQVVESGPSAEVLKSPAHPYTQALIGSVPELGRSNARLISIPGTVPNLDQPRGSCWFQPRCSRALPQCSTDSPVLETTQGTRSLRCFNPVPPTP